MDWFAINDTELRQFHMAGLVAGGGDSVLPVVNGIRERKISYTSEAEKPTANKARQVSGSEPPYTQIAAIANEIESLPSPIYPITQSNIINKLRQLLPC